MVLGAMTLNDRRVCVAIAALGQPVDDSGVRVAVTQALQQVRSGGFPGFTWVSGLLDTLASRSAVRFPEKLFLFRKALLTLSGVVADVSEQTTIDSVLIRQGASDFIEGLAWRPWTWAYCRDRVGAHLSNADLVHLWAELPATALRFWAGGHG